MALKIGNVDRYIVEKETDIAYTLHSLDELETTDIFLHFNQTKKRLRIGEQVNAFLYYDQKKRLCATTEEPLITTTKANFCEVLSVHGSMGLFLNMGIAKDILLSSDFLPKNTAMWPKPGDLIPVIVKVKTDQLIAKLVNNNEIKETSKLTVCESVDATIYRISNEGISLCTKEFNQIFVHRSLIRNKYRLGEVINVKIININEQGNYNGTLIANKEIVRIDDSEMILRYLQMHGGSCPIGDKSTPEDILKYFPLSKSAFKRAIGNLYRQELITIKENLIKLND